MAIHIVEEANRCLGCKKAFCQIKGCPVQTPIPQVIDLFKQRRLQEAGELLFQNNPMSADPLFYPLSKMHSTDINPFCG